jgi:uncharacterized membrane protein YdjX (TVP38/TMEM64 family)
VSLTIDSVRELILGMGPLGPLVAIGLYVLHSFVPFPAQILTFAIGAVYGPLWGTVLVWIGAMAGAYAAFGVARWGGRPLATRFIAGHHIQRFDDWFDRYGVGALLIVRLVPLISFNLINYSAGLTRVSWWTFTWTTGLGILPITILEIIAVDQLRQGNPLGMWLFGGIVLLGAVTWLIKRRRTA